MAHSFSTEVNATDGATVIHVRGEIDMATAGRLRDAIEPHMGPGDSIVLDLSEVDFMDSSCLHVLVQARGRLTENGGSLVLRNPSRAAQRVLTVSGATHFLGTDARGPTPQIQTDLLPDARSPHHGVSLEHLGRSNTRRSRFTARRKAAGALAASHCESPVRSLTRSEEKPGAGSVVSS